MSLSQLSCLSYKYGNCRPYLPEEGDWECLPASCQAPHVFIVYFTFQRREIESVSQPVVRPLMYSILYLPEEGDLECLPASCQALLHIQ